MLRRTVQRFVNRAGKREELVFESMFGFELREVRRIDELNLVAYDMEHTATGASYYHVDVDDVNNTFCIGFRTPAENSKGTSHVLEHTTLCGSTKYPVRDPFFMMLKRSLSSFMNAMTGADYTLYPFSTTNVKDFQNLLDVYLDAVFHPLLREEDFKQEGHRVEVESGNEESTDAENKERRLVHNGVVYNEMRGVVSQPSTHFRQALLTTMLPQTHYMHVSGGYPPDILRLTHAELLDFHQRHYNPSNSITFTYGDQHPESHMRALNAYFGSFSRTGSVHVPTLTDGNRFIEPKQVRLDGPLDAMGNPRRQKRVAVSYAVPKENNTLQDMVELSVLDALLSSGPSSPMFKSLIEPQIGSQYAPMQGYAYYLSSPVITYGVDGVDEERQGVEEEVLTAVESALRSVQKDGFDERRVRSVIFQEELQQRHRSADYGLNVCTGLCAMGLCRSQNNPLDFIDWLPHLKKLADNNAASLLPRIESHLLNNPHRAVVSVSAKQDYLNQLRDELREKDDELNIIATEEDKNRIEEETRDWLRRVREVQPSDVLPTLHINDIPKRSFAEPVPQVSSLSSGSGCSSGASLYTISYPTNGLVYVHGLIPFSEALTTAMASGDLSSVSANTVLLSSLLGSTGASHLSYKEHSIAVELACGGFAFSPLLNESYLTKRTAITGVSYGFYTTMEKLPEALNLLATTLFEPRISPDDEEVYSRALSQLKMGCSGMIQSLQAEGNRIAVTAATAQLTRRGQLREHWWGLSQCRHASDLLEQLQGEGSSSRVAMQGLLQEYGALAKDLTFTMSTSTMWATCEEQHRGRVEQLMADFICRFPSAEEIGPTHLALPTMQVPSGVQRIYRKLPIDTSFVGYALPNSLTWECPEQARVRVACLLLSNEYLHRRVREEGGAYGSNCAATLQGEIGGISMSSYRDPSPELSAKAFMEAGEWLSRSSNISQRRVAEAKLRLFASIDAPYAADSFGEAYFYHDVRQETKQAMRDALLAVTPQDVMSVAHYFVPKDTTIVSILQPSEEGAGDASKTDDLFADFAWGLY